MKKTICLWMMIIGVCLYAGCAKETTGMGRIDDSTENTVTANNTGYSEVLNLSEYTLDDESAFDASQPYLAVTDDGIYFWGKVWNEEFNVYYFAIEYYDFETKEIVPLCNRADCSHDDADCNAVLGTTDGMSFYTDEIYYYDGYVYVLCHEIYDGEINLYRISEDGSTRESYMTLFYVAVLSEDNAAEQEYYAPYVCIKDGYVYFVNNNEAQPVLRRMRLGENTAEVLFENEADRAMIYGMSGNGDYLFFESMYYLDDSYTDYEGGVYAYNCITGEITILIDAFTGYYIQNNTLYYYLNNELRARSLETGEESVIPITFEWSGSMIYFIKDEVIYLFDYDTLTLYAYDFEGTKLAELTDETLMMCVYSYSSYIWAEGTDEEGNYYTKTMNMDDFAGGDVEWTVLYLANQ